MRRHYRNHTTPGFSRSQPNDNRRRRRRVTPQGASRNSIALTTERQQFVQAPPISSLAMGEDSDDEEMSDAMEGTHAEEEDQLESSDSSPRQQRTFLYSNFRNFRKTSACADLDLERVHDFLQSHVRSVRRSPSSPPSSPSPSPPPSYSPSAPYVRSLADTRVSTALRPAFHPTSLAGKKPVKQEPTSDVW